MPPPGKSQPPKAVRDARVDSTPPGRDPRADGPPPSTHVDEFRPSNRSLKAAKEAKEATAKSDDVEDLAAMLVQIADTERAREASEKRASGLETWTQALEAKVAAERTRADELEQASTARKKELEEARQAFETKVAEVVALKARLDQADADVAAARQAGEEALEAERVKRGHEIDALVEQHQSALGVARAEAAAASIGPVRDALAKMVKTLEEVDEHESEARALRAGVLVQARRALASQPTTSPPPQSEPSPAKHLALTIPPITKRKRSKRPPAPPPASTPTPLSVKTPITTPGEKLETFEDLDLE